MTQTKSIKNRICFLLISILILSFSAFPQTAEPKKDEIEISVCRPEITEMGGQSSFRFNYSYKIITDDAGAVKEVKEILDHKKFRSLMNDKNVISCIRKWKLKPSERYSLTISVGTTGGEEFIFLINKLEKVKIIL